MRNVSPRILLRDRRGVGRLWDGSAARAGQIQITVTNDQPAAVSPWLRSGSAFRTVRSMRFTPGSTASSADRHAGPVRQHRAAFAAFESEQCRR